MITSYRSSGGGGGGGNVEERHGEMGGWVVWSRQCVHICHCYTDLHGDRPRGVHRDWAGAVQRRVLEREHVDIGKLNPEGIGYQRLKPKE